MRRVLLAVAITGTIVSTAACGGTGGGSASPSPSATSASPSASPTTSPTPTASANYAADTKRICGEIEKSIESDMTDFGEELGKMIAYRQAGSTARANEAKADAQAELRTIAAGMRQRTANAQDPELRAAGQESAENLEASAADEAFFRRLRTVNDVKAMLEKEVVTWLLPLAEFCAP
jgi:hypothetical protein